MPLGFYAQEKQALFLKQVVSDSTWAVLRAFSGILKGLSTGKLYKYISSAI